MIVSLGSQKGSQKDFRSLVFSGEYREILMHTKTIPYVRALLILMGSAYCVQSSAAPTRTPIGHSFKTAWGGNALSKGNLGLIDSNATATHQTNSIEGWTVLVSRRLLTEEKEATAKALELMREQLQEIVRVVPAPAVAKLREVTLWFSPEYAGVQPRAEYHPGAGWLRDNGRDPAMVKSVEFTNVRSFESETKRMPNFTLHELAHGYHDRVLSRGFDNAEIKAAFQKAKAGGKYNQVQRRDAKGNMRLDRAYALTNPMEYFAESTEAFFSTNDFFPFNRAELEQHDPEMERLLGQLWGTSK